MQKNYLMPLAIIWNDILFAVNKVSKELQYLAMCSGDNSFMWRPWRNSLGAAAITFEESDSLTIVCDHF